MGYDPYSRLDIDPPPVRIGDTPRHEFHVPIHGLRHTVWIKQEGENPFGSIKDRVAWALINRAHREGRLQPGARVIDASSGNFAAALAGLCARLKANATIVCPPKMTQHNRRAVEGAGARLIIVAGDYQAAAADIAKREGGVYLDQYNNPLNPEVHRVWTAPETLDDLGSIDAVFVAASTGGTAQGFLNYIKAAGTSTDLIVVDSLTSRAVAPAETEDSSLSIFQDSDLRDRAASLLGTRQHPF